MPASDQALQNNRLLNSLTRDEMDMFVAHASHFVAEPGCVVISQVFPGPCANLHGRKGTKGTSFQFRNWKSIQSHLSWHPNGTSVVDSENRAMWEIFSTWWSRVTWRFWYLTLHPGKGCIFPAATQRKDSDHDGASFSSFPSLGKQVHGVTVGTCASGQSFGDLALLYGDRRAATVTATEESHLWRIDRDTFRYVMAVSSLQQTQTALECLKQVAPTCACIWHTSLSMLSV